MRMNALVTEGGNNFNYLVLKRRSAFFYLLENMGLSFIFWWLEEKLRGAYLAKNEAAQAEEAACAGEETRAKITARACR